MGPKLIKDVGFKILKRGRVTYVTQKDVVNYTKLWIQCEKGTSTLTWTKDVKMWMKNGLGFGDIHVNFFLQGQKL